MPPSIRRARAADVAALVALMRDFYREDGDPFVEDEARASFATLAATPSWGAVWVAEDGETLAGYAVLTFGFSMEFGGRDAFLDDLYIVAARRGQGLGRALIAACETACTELGIRALHLEVRDGNPAASLYRRLGFEDHKHRLMTKRVLGTRDDA